MYSTENYSDQIEDYLKGNLSAEQATAFEAILKTDPALKADFLFQKSVITTIQAGRKAELKARLNAIPTPAHQTRYWRYFATAGIITAVVVAFNFIPVDLFRQNKADVKVATSDKLENLGPLDATEEDLVNSVEQETAMPVTEAKEPQKEAVKRKTAKAPEVASEPVKESMPSLPEVHSPEFSAHDHVSREVETPDHSLIQSKHISASVAGVEVVKSKKHKFHYRYFDTKLFLYGDFDTRTYDILELNNSRGQKLYLKFEANYYELEPNKTEISKLEPVKSKETLKELEDIQKNR